MPQNVFIQFSEKCRSSSTHTHTDTQKRGKRGRKFRITRAAHSNHYTFVKYDVWQKVGRALSLVDARFEFQWKFFFLHFFCRHDWFKWNQYRIWLSNRLTHFEFIILLIRRRFYLFLFCYLKVANHLIFTVCECLYIGNLITICVDIFKGIPRSKIQNILVQPYNISVSYFCIQLKVSQIQTQRERKSDGRGGREMKMNSSNSKFLTSNISVNVQ